MSRDPPDDVIVTRIVIVIITDDVISDVTDDVTGIHITIVTDDVTGIRIVIITDDIISDVTDVVTSIGIVIVTITDDVTDIRIVIITAMKASSTAAWTKFRGQKTGDYHEEMDGARFEKWFEGVLDKLPRGNVIIMDNASYHSRRLEAVPTTSSRKDDIRQWPTSKNISWNPKMLKKQLLDTVALVKLQHLKYCVDTAAETAGCSVVRLPPYHCKFNPIELIWAQIKNGVAARNTTFKIVDVGTLLKEEVDKVATDNWINAVRHVVDIEATF
ncbi:uncharacterized protein ISCGN_009909 [Ixodes scapularis]